MSVKTDNDILNFIKKSGKESTYVEPDIPSIRSDVFLNWTKTSSVSKVSETDKAVKTAEKYKEMGMNADQVKNTLIGDGYSIELSKTASKEVFKEQGIEGIPTSYEDLKHNIENLITSMGGKTFFKLITASGKVKDAVVVLASATAEAQLQDLLRYVDDRGAVQGLMNEVHATLQPHFDDEINKSYLLAEVKSDNIKLASSNVKQVYSMVDENDTYSVDLENVHCNCNRYASRNFSALGIPCEHIVVAYNKTSEKSMINRIKQSLLSEF